MNTFLKLI